MSFVIDIVSPCPERLRYRDVRIDNSVLQRVTESLHGEPWCRSIFTTPTTVLSPLPTSTLTVNRTGTRSQ